MVPMRQFGSTRCRGRWWFGLAAGAWLTLLPSAVATDSPRPDTAEPEPVHFDRDIRPILANHCYTCHGPDSNKRKADLFLDVAEAYTADRGGYRIVVPGRPEESELYLRITAEDEAERMPPAGGKPLRPEQIDAIRRWIRQGAKWQPHWSLVRPERPPVPNVRDEAWPRNAIDRFILHRLELAGMAPAARADRRTLIRRLSFDLTGLPPTPEQVRQFQNDRRPHAYERLVDRLLASPHYGERMAVYWLDLVRYADSIGYHSDNPRNVSPYRDYVIQAFNANMPFDQFTREQLAGDLLPQSTLWTRVASGYNRLLQTTEEGGAQPKEYAAKYMADRVRNVSSVWLGATMGCAECHNHKFDRFSTREFYSLAAFFADVNEKPVGRREPGILVPSAEQSAELKRLEREIAQARKKLLEPTGIIAAAPLSPWASLLNPALADFVRGQRARIALERQIPRCLVTVAVAPRTIRVLPRGNWLDDSGPVVEPTVPAAIGHLTVDGRRPNRLDLANWLVSRNNPLTARVFVNRLWKLFFGHGLARSLDDLGTQGQWPSHPHLLDWLAVEFVDSGWNVKHMVRLMVTSQAYRQASSANRERDPENQLFGRQTAFRLDAEFVRDNALAISGLLVRRIGGPSVKPYQPKGYWAYLNFPRRTYQADHGPSQYRRGKLR